MILATRSSAKTLSFVGKQAGASIPTCSTENGGAKFRKKNGNASEMRSKPCLSVQANMIESRNGQSQSEGEQSKRKGRFTGQRLKLLRPETYRQAVELLAEPREQVPYDHICRLLRASEHTLKAIQKAESLSIAERKQRLLDKALRIASKAADSVEDQIDDANITQATVAFGVSTEKIMLLLGESDGGVPVQINLYPGVAELLHKPEPQTVLNNH
jgi:hypothetical protein